MELLVVVAILMTLAGMAIPRLLGAMEQARYARAVSEVRTLEGEVLVYAALHQEQLPGTLDDIGRGNFSDPWGTPYQYLNFALTQGKGQMRKDRFLVPLNSDFDLYSMGKDRKSKPPLTAQDSRDDIIRANDGSYIGLAIEY